MTNRSLLMLPVMLLLQVNPNIVRDKWTPDEDAALLALVTKHGYHWAEIARQIPGRTDQQCLGRWRRHVDPSVRRVGGWVVNSSSSGEVAGTSARVRRVGT
jgi:hypothetical protein